MRILVASILLSLCCFWLSGDQPEMPPVPPEPTETKKEQPEPRYHEFTIEFGEYLILSAKVLDMSSGSAKTGSGSGSGGVLTECCEVEVPSTLTVDITDLGGCSGLDGKKIQIDHEPTGTGGHLWIGAVTNPCEEEFQLACTGPPNKTWGATFGNFSNHISQNLISCDPLEIEFTFENVTGSDCCDSINDQIKAVVTE